VPCPQVHDAPADAPTETDADRTPPPHPIAALKTLAAQTLGVAESADIATLRVFKRSFDARKVDLLAVYIVDITLADPAQKPHCWKSLQATRTSSPRPTWPGTPWARPRPTCPCARWWWALAPAAFLRRWCWRKWVSSPSCWSAASRARAHQGHLGPVAQARAQPRKQCAVWRRRRGHLLDGKLYSQIKDPRHLGRKVMNEFVKAGAPEEILYEAHPHIGTFKLVKVVENLREQIIALGGEIRFRAARDRCAG
jgi:hypothetical protein